MTIYNHFINGAWVEPSSGEYFETENPYSGEVWANIARGNAEDADRAVKAAKAAFDDGEWAEMCPTQRGKLLVRLAEIIERESTRLGELEVRDNGKLIAEMGGQQSILPNGTAIMAVLLTRWRVLFYRPIRQGFSTSPVTSLLALSQ